MPLDLATEEESFHCLIPRGATGYAPVQGCV